MANNSKNLFEATIAACQKVKNESATSATKKKATNKRNKINESKKQIRRKPIKESDEFDDIPDDVSDEIIVVTDPEMNADEYEGRISELQDIIDETPEGEIPVDDEYIGDEVYTCPQCGNNFFSEDDMSEGGECPVCGEDVEAFVLVGKVGDSEEEYESDVVDEEDLDTVDDDDTELDVIDDDDDLDESTDMEINHDDEENYSDYSLDENTLNPFLNKFIRENYKRVESMNLKRASIKGNVLSLECLIKFKNGKEKSTNLKVENFNPKQRFIMKATADKAFKAESKENNSHFVMEATMKDNNIKINKFRYSFITKNEGKRYQIYGKYALKESAPRTSRKSIRRTK